MKTSAAKANIIENRAEERAHERTTRLNGAIPPPAKKAGKPPKVDASGASPETRKTKKLKQLWSKIDGARTN